MAIPRPGGPNEHILDIGIESLSDRNVAPIVYVQRWLHASVVADLPHQFLQDGVPILSHRIERAVDGEVFVILIHEPARPKTTSLQLRDHAVVPRGNGSTRQPEQF